LRHLGTLAERIYDLPLFVPLWIEGAVRGGGNGPGASGATGHRGRIVGRRCGP